jgi:uncharacterized membrane protein
MSNPADPLQRNVQVIADLERQAAQKRSSLEHAAGHITRAAGSGTFLAAHILFFSGWIVWNQGRHTFDPYPFALLNVIVSIEAIILTSLVLMTQNRMTRQAEQRAHLDLQINLLAEQELTAILQMIYALCQKAGTCARVHDAHVEQLLRKTDVVELAASLERELTDPSNQHSRVP